MCIYMLFAYSQSVLNGSLKSLGRATTPPTPSFMQKSIDFVLFGNNKRQFLYECVPRLASLHVFACICACVYVYMHMYGCLRFVAIARKQLSFGLEPEFRSSATVFFCFSFFFFFVRDLFCLLKYVCARTHTHAQICMCTYVSAYLLCYGALTGIFCQYQYMCMYACTHVCKHVCKHVCMQACVYACVHVLLVILKF